jgi:hypothetical protein
VLHPFAAQHLQHSRREIPLVPLKTGRSRTEDTEGREVLKSLRSCPELADAPCLGLHSGSTAKRRTFGYAAPPGSDLKPSVTSVSSVRDFPFLGSQPHPSLLATVSPVSSVTSVRFPFPSIGKTAVYSTAVDTEQASGLGDVAA